MQNLQLAQLYDKAANLIEQRGWVQGREKGDGGALCLNGALVVASGDDASHRTEEIVSRKPSYLLARATEVIAERLKDLVIGVCQCSNCMTPSPYMKQYNVLANWNDSSCRH